MAERHFLTGHGLRLSYLDYGGSGDPLLAIHGHFSCARTFAPLASTLRDHWRVWALDQRGHGWSEASTDYSRVAYVRDLEILIEALEIAPLVLLGHSLGGINAFQLAARRPDMVRALIIEDVGPAPHESHPLVPDWPTRFDSMRQLLEFADSRDWVKDPYFLESLVEYPDGWGFRFDAIGLVSSQQHCTGDWWADWMGSDCPALLLHGHQSGVLDTAVAREMAARRPHTTLVEFPHCGHTPHDQDPAGFQAAVRDFLATLH